MMPLHMLHIHTEEDYLNRINKRISLKLVSRPFNIAGKVYAFIEGVYVEKKMQYARQIQTLTYETHNRTVNPHTAKCTMHRYCMKKLQLIQQSDICIIPIQYIYSFIILFIFNCKSNVSILSVFTLFGKNFLQN